MKSRSSVRSLRKKRGSIVTRRRGHVVVLNKREPRWKARQA
ncbi:ribosomal protein bL36 [Pseudonocardia sp. MH-G8]|nr:ribosomal protein bL36 [Pseudonocardia sp. MH-G8]OZM80670.1 50S ribosomal protein L36 [Pseudonocardia sp. MH-G8]